MSDSTLEEQQAQTVILSDIKADLDAQGATIEAQAVDVAALKAKVDSYEGAFWILAFTGVLFFGAFLFRIFSRSASSKRLLGLLLGLGVSISAFAIPSWSADVYYSGAYDPSVPASLSDNIYLAPAVNDAYFGDHIDITFYDAAGYVITMSASDDMEGTTTVYPSVTVTSSAQTFSFDTYPDHHFTFTAVASGGSSSGYSPPSDSCDSDTKYNELKAALKTLFPDLSDKISPDSSAISTDINFSGFGYFSWTSNNHLEINTEEFRVNSFSLHHSSWSGPLRTVFTFVIAISLFAYCFNQVKSW